MATGVNVKMGVTGVSQFKQNIKSAKDTLKTLDAQLALTEKEFKASGDAEAYMAKKTEELKAKLKEQKDLVNNAQKALDQMAKNGVDRSSKSYQDLYREMLKTKGEMIDTEQQLYGISYAGEEAANSMSSMGHQLKRVNDNISLQNVTQSLDKITGGMEAAAKRAIQLGKAILHGTMDAAHQADELITRSTKYGIGVEELQAMDYVAEYVDTDVETIIAARKRLQKAMGSSDNETKGVFAALGIDPKNMDWEDVFWKAGEALKGLDDEVNQNNYATKLFGKNYDDLLPLFETGRQKYKEMLSEQTVLTEDQVKALGAEDDAMKRMEQQLDVLQKQFWAGLAPAITEATDALSGLVEQFNIYLQSEKGQEMLKAMGDVVSGLFSDLTKIDPEETIKGVVGVFDNITSALQWVADNKDGVVTGVKAFVGAWAALETAKGVTIALQLINGIKGLTTAGAAAGASAGASWGAAFAAAVAKAAPWLIGLYEIVKPSAGGNDDLIDENGQLTETAKKAGYDLNGNGELIKPNNGYELTIDKLTPHSEWNTTGEAVDLTQKRLASVRDWDSFQASNDKMLKAAEDLTGGSNVQKQSSSEMIQAAGELKGLPGVIQDAIRSGMAGISVYIDGRLAGNVLTPYINSKMGSLVGSLVK